MAAMAWLIEAFSGDNHSWKQLEVLKRYWDGPIVLKGILHPEDAILAWQHGLSGIIVSNHGGRNVDGAVAALDMLSEMVAAVWNMSNLYPKVSIGLMGSHRVTLPRT
ncbi:FMN-dependent dehydrogenase-domain-containing protein [Nemania serpens]|nr:FMN-dependent dehydrogenase-domain-containing protein [Nemania serpens]